MAIVDMMGDVCVGWAVVVVVLLHVSRRPVTLKLFKLCIVYCHIEHQERWRRYVCQDVSEGHVVRCTSHVHQGHNNTVVFMNIYITATVSSRLSLFILQVHVC